MALHNHPNAYYKITYFFIQDGKVGPTVDRFMSTRSELSRFISANKHRIADIVVFTLHNNKVVTDEFKRYLNT